MSDSMITYNYTVSDSRLKVLVGLLAAVFSFGSPGVSDVQARDQEYFVIDGASHIQTYYVPEYVNAVVGKLQEFFGKNL